MIIYIEQIKIELTENQYGGLYLTMGGQKNLLPGQSFEQAETIIRKNFEILKSQFLKTASSKIKIEELNEVCLKIVLYWYGLHNSWKYSNEKEKDRDLSFQLKEIQHPYTMDILIPYFKNKNPNDYAEKCASLLDISTDKLLKDESDRAFFYASFR